MHFFAKKFGHIKKKQYLCTRFQELEKSETPKISNFWGERSALRSTIQACNAQSCE